MPTRDTVKGWIGRPVTVALVTTIDHDIRGRLEDVDVDGLVVDGVHVPWSAVAFVHLS